MKRQTNSKKSNKFIPVKAPEQDRQCVTHMNTVGYVKKITNGWLAFNRSKKPFDN